MTVFTCPKGTQLEVADSAIPKCPCCGAVATWLNRANIPGHLKESMKRVVASYRTLWTMLSAINTFQIGVR